MNDVSKIANVNPIYNNIESAALTPALDRNMSVKKSAGPLVSVIIVTYNRALFLPEAIESILSQTWHNWEIVIVDDASVDETTDIIEKYIYIGIPIKHIKNDCHLGIAASRNLGLKIASGEYIAVLDSDDVWASPDKLERQIKFLAAHRDVVVLGTGAVVINFHGQPIGVVNYASEDKEVRQKFLFSNQFLHSSIVFIRSLALEVGGYGDYPIGEDYDFLLKLGGKGKLANLPEALVKYRRHNHGVTWSDQSLAASCHLRIIGKYKNAYPNYCLAFLKGCLRMIFAFIK